MEPRDVSGVRKLTLLSLLVLLIAVAVLAATASTPAASSQSQDAEARARQYLRENAQALGLRPDLNDLKVVEVREGLSSTHVRYQQTFRGLPVFGSYTTVSLPKMSEAPPFLVSRYVAHPRSSLAPAKIRAVQATAIVDDLLTLTATNLRGEVTLDAVYFPRDKQYVAAWQVIAPTVSPLGTWLVVVAADDGSILLQHNLLRFDSGQVFDPNPGKTNGGTAPATDCDSSAEEASLSSEYFTRSLLGIQAGQDKLKGEFVDLTAPGILGAYKAAGQADEPSRNFIYPCNDDKFEEAMVYYHIDTTQRKIQSLGFTGSSGIVDGPIAAHAHYFVDCNAFYDPSNRGIHFGDSDVTSGPPFLRCNPTTDAAEDADVIVHEYGHAIQHDQVPGWAFGPYPAAEEAAAMGEGFGDFLAGAIFGDPCLGEYVNFGQSECDGSPGLRWIQNTNVYPADFDACTNTGPSSSEEPHCGGELWGAALWDLAEALGNNQAARDLVLQLVLDAHFYLDPTSTFAEAAAAIRQADTILYSGAHVSTIDSVFAARGIATGGPIDDFPSAFLRIRHTFRGDLDTQIQVGDPASPACTINLTDPSSNGADDITAYLNLTSSPCVALLPPSVAQPWHLEVQDFGPADIGSIENFEVLLVGGERCVAINTPVAIPDAISGTEPGPKVYATVDCTVKFVPSADSDGDGVSDGSDICPDDYNPDQLDTDTDGSGDACDPDDDNDSLGLGDPFGLFFRDEVELFLGTLPLVACPATSIPDDEDPDATGPDWDDSQDVDGSDVFLFAQRFGTESGVPPPVGKLAYIPRFDIYPTGASLNKIDGSDVFVLATYFGKSCA